MPAAKSRTPAPAGRSKAATPDLVAGPSNGEDTGTGSGLRIVTSAHLVSAKSPELSEFEFGLIIAAHAFNRWMIRCMSAAGVKDMAPVDVLVLHHTNHRGSEKRLSDICFVLNIEDTHVVSYALKKLMGAGLVSSTKRGKEAFFSTTPKGQTLCADYRTVRESCLMPGFSGAEEENERIGDAARLLRTLSGRYDQAARAATSF
ncbi:MAG: transcriptional regulator [Ideonella sp. MAG2]|nr:MAG: transcriptional regulator [Ideonella sp. MAG2]